VPSPTNVASPNECPAPVRSAVRLAGVGRTARINYSRNYPSVAVLIPCFNEATAIGAVVGDFRKALPDAQIHVFDNNSSDGTAQAAVAAGANVHKVTLQGKGHTVRRMFADVEADTYVLVDGDGTYDAASAPLLIAQLRDYRLDMVVGVRAHEAAGAYRRGHILGNRLLTGFLGWMFGRACSDILSGYRAFSRRFVKSFPVLSSGFEIETEITVHALELRVPIGERVTAYFERPVGSYSKLNTYRDGFRILLTMVRLFSAERPLLFYSAIAFLLALLSVALAIPVLVTYAQTGSVPRFPTAILSTGLMLLGALAFFAGLILDTVTRGRREIKALAYLRGNPPD
jgi:glycosyltransferase involved in cell wall biosynthesis